MTTEKTESQNAFIKRIARKSLLGHWKQAVAVSLLLFAAQLFSSMLLRMFDLNGTDAAFYMGLGVSAIVELFLSLLMYGALLFFLNLLRGKKAVPEDLIRPFRMQPDRYLIVSLIRMLISVVLYLPLLLLIILSPAGADYYVAAFYGCFFAGSLLNLAAGLFFIPAPFLLLDHEEKGALEAIREGFALLKGKKGQLVRCLLPFIGYALLAVCTLGLALLWILPYLLTTLAEFYRTLTGEQMADEAQTEFQAPAQL